MLNIDIASIVKALAPNPLAATSRLSDAEKKVEVVQEGIGVLSSVGKGLRNVVGLIIIGLILITQLHLPMDMVILFILTQIISNFILLGMKISQLKAIHAIQNQDNAQAYREMLIKKEYYEFRQSIFNVVSTLVIVVLMFVLFGQEITQFVGQNI